MSRILVTGATGFIGKNLLDLLISKNEEIIVFSTHSQSDLVLLKEMKIKNILYEEDLEKNNIPLDYCIHLASYGVNYNDKNLDTMIDVNIKLSSKILTFCINNSCKAFISAGSCFEYGTQFSDFIDETSSLNAEDIYAATKIACHDLLKTIAKKNGLRFLICRPFGVYGKYEPNHRLLPTVFECGIKNKVLDLTSGEQVRDYLYVKDVANAFYEILLNINNFKFFDVVNICSGVPCSVKEFVKEIILINGFDESLFRFGMISYRKNESMRLVGSNKKLLQLTNWTQKYSLKKGLEDYAISRKSN